MKNLFLGLTFLVMLSCSNEQIKDVEKSSEFTNRTIQNASLEEKLKYKKEHLAILANIISQNLKNESLKNKIYSAIDANETSQTFLYEDLFKLLNIDDVKMTSLQKSLSAFVNLDGVNWKPALTVYRNRPDIQARLIVEEPLFFFVEQESDFTKSSFPGYEGADDTEAGMIKVGDFTYEETAGRLLLISDIISADPSENSGGGTPVYGGSGTPTLPVAVNYNPTLIRMHKMKIGNRKEDWISGDSEVHMVGFITGDAPAISGFCGDFLQGAANCYNTDGKRIDKIARRWINNLHQYDYVFQNYSIAGSANGAVMNYVIFEQDSWPAPEATKQFNFPNGTFRQIKYHTWQSPFDDKQLSRFQNTSFPFAGNFVGDNSDIYYIMQGL